MYREASSTGTANAPADQDNQKHHHHQQEEEENHKLRFAGGTEGATRSVAVALEVNHYRTHACLDVLSHTEANSLIQYLEIAPELF